VVQWPPTLVIMAGDPNEESKRETLVMKECCFLLRYFFCIAKDFKFD